MGWGYGMGWWMWPVMLVGILGFWAIVAVVVRAILRDRRPSGLPPEPPLSILDRRLASGEIDAEQYRQLRRTLLDGH